MTSPALEVTTGSRLLWTYAPLAAFVILSLPLISALFLPGTEHYDLSDYVFFLLVLCFGPNWSFLALFVVTRQDLQRKMYSVGLVTVAMWSSLAAMLVPVGLLWLYVLTQDYSVRGMGRGVAILLAFAQIGFMILLPFFGVIGWFVGRWLYRSRHRETGRR